jgi:hypothetical protein
MTDAVGVMKEDWKGQKDEDGMKGGDLKFKRHVTRRLNVLGKSITALRQHDGLAGIYRQIPCILSSKSNQSGSDGRGGQ